MEEHLSLLGLFSSPPAPTNDSRLFSCWTPTICLLSVCSFLCWEPLPAAAGNDADDQNS